MGWPLAAALVGSNLASTLWTNNQNRDMMNDQMAFQTMMSNTGHQREVEDLRAAGLNPILSAGGTGASASAGGMATAENPQGGILNGISSALSIQSQLNQNKSVEKDIEAKDAAIENTKADTTNKVLNSPILKNQGISSGYDASLKEKQNRLMDKTFDAQIRKANIEGRTYLENTYEGLKHGASHSAKSYMDFGKVLPEAIMQFMNNQMYGTKP